MKKRFENTKKFVLKTLLLNNRFKTYEQYIKYALENDYYVCSMDEFYKNKDNGKRKFVLRHDVDDFLPNTRIMYEIEKKLGVHSTYYFRWSTIDKKLIIEMLDSGFDVGLHYETVGTFIRENKITDKTQIDLNDLRNTLKEEIIIFKKDYNPNMTSCCSHGAPENIKLDISSNVLLEDVDYNDFGIKFEAYDKNLYEKYNIYHIMDGNIRFNFGFSYKSNPIDAINRNEKNIIFLAHPTYWKSQFKLYIINLLAFILGKRTFDTERVFKRIAK